MSIKKTIKQFFIIYSLILVMLFGIVSPTIKFMPNNKLKKLIPIENLYDNSSISSKIYAEESYKVSDDKNEHKKVERKDYTEVIDNIEGGSTFESIIAKAFANCIGGVMSVVSNHSGMKTLDGLIFNAGGYVDGFTPISKTDWNNINKWYVFMTALSAGLLSVSIFIIFVKFVKASGNVQYRREAINSLKRLGASTIIIGLAPIIIHLLLYINNNMVYAFYTTIIGDPQSLTNCLEGPAILTKLSKNLTSPLAGVLILGLFAFLQLKLNVLFIIRNFNIIVFTIFSPFAATIWIVDENINGAKVWLGELLSNIFMQMSYAFLFSLYISFIGEKGWLTQLIWGHVILALGDIIRNMFQGKLTELSGINENKIAGNILGGGMIAAAVGLSAIGDIPKAFTAQKPQISKTTNSIPNVNSNDLNYDSNSVTMDSTSNENKSNKANVLRKTVETGAKITKGAFTMGAMPIAIASGNPHAVQHVKNTGQGIEQGINTLGNTGITVAEKTVDTVMKYR